MNIFENYIKNIKENQLLKEAIDKLVYSWLIAHYKLWYYNPENYNPKEQIGYLYIGPNESYSKDHFGYNDFCKTKWGWSWKFTDNYEAIKITFNTVKNEWLDINEDNEKIVSFEELLKYNNEN